MKYTDMVNKVTNGEEGSINLPLEDVVTFTKILLKRGYAVLFTAGEIEPDVRIDWRYAGDIDSLDCANRQNIAFGSPDYIDNLVAGEYEPDEEF